MDLVYNDGLKQKSRLGRDLEGQGVQSHGQGQ